jgi:DNA-binding LytR/AlgR family response regulator
MDEGKPDSPVIAVDCSDMDPNALKVKVLIADDELLIAKSLASRILTFWPNAVLSAICTDGQHALSSIREQQPDIAFLDISMPFATGMDIAEIIDRDDELVTQVVFVTAYDAYAVEAFERNAIDYLLKPLSEQRLLKTLRKLERLLAQQNKPLPIARPEFDKGSEPREVSKASSEVSNHLVVKVGDRKKVIPLEAVICLVADGKHTCVVSEPGDYWVSQSLGAMEEQLPGERFWRVHRSSLVNPDYINETKRTETGRLELALRGTNKRLLVSRRFLWRFKSH